MGVVSELKRRNVLRMAVLYVVAAWLVMQVADAVIGLASLPAWSGQLVLAVLAVGFPIALIFSWLFEITPEGLALEKEVPAGHSITHVTGRRMDFVIIAILSAGLLLLAYDKWWIGPPSAKSIAVLAFENMSTDPEQEFFSDGISEEVLILLSQNPDLTVISRSSAFSFKGQDLPISQIAKQLNVSHVLEGTVRKAGNRIRITAQLIDARSDKQIWSDSYDRGLDDIFAVQREIAEAISDALKVTLRAGGPDVMANSKKLTENLEAYENYLRGRYLWQRRGEKNIRRAISLFEQATELDPKFARAWSSMAAAHNTLPFYLMPTDSTFFLTVDSARLEARSAANKALDLDSSLAEAHAVLGDIARLNREWAEAEGHYLRAIASEPKNSTARLWYAEHLGDVGRSREALEESLIAYELDPMNLATNIILTCIYWQLNDTDNAVKYGIAGWELSLERGGAAGLKIQALANVRIGKLDRAIKFAEQYDQHRVNPVDYPVAIFTQFVKTKIDTGKTQILLETLAEHEAVMQLPILLLSYIEFGRNDAAYRVLETRLDHFRQLRWVLWNPETATFRQDPRFAGLVNELGLPDYWREHGWPDSCGPAGESVKCK